VPLSSTGARGVTAVKATVMGRDVNLDPANQKWIVLDLWILLDAQIAGYTPSAVITAQSNTSGTTWALTCSTANAFNIIVSTSGNGQNLEHFANGDYIKICEVNSTGGSDVTGTISGTPSASAGTCTVVLDGAWVPGTASWSLEFNSDNGTTATTNQQAYAYVADTNKKLASGGRMARNFA
jgi:hypothetical protein